jgi:hypothetical protein
MKTIPIQSDWSDLVMLDDLGKEEDDTWEFDIRHMRFEDPDRTGFRFRADLLNNEVLMEVRRLGTKMSTFGHPSIIGGIMSDFGTRLMTFAGQIEE